MATQSEVMHCYEQIAPITEQMLALARAGQWGDLPPLEAQQSAMVDHLKSIEDQELLSEAQVARKYQLLERITTVQAEIASIVLPQLKELGSVITSISRKHLLHQTYGGSNEPMS